MHDYGMPSLQVFLDCGFLLSFTVTVLLLFNETFPLVSCVTVQVTSI